MGTRLSLSRINTALFIAVIGINLYIIVAPLLPVASFWVGSHITHQFDKLNARLQQTPGASGSLPAIPQDNRLIIPAMQLDVGINEGKDVTALRTGPWRRPNGSTPDKGGNTVIAAHRYTYTNPRGTFYFLNKLQPGDEVGVFWHGKRYLYKVATVATVPPTAVDVEAPTSDARLTLYTCTPLWNPKDRLVITAEREQQ